MSNTSTLRWTGRKPKTGIQEAARNARYRLLSEEAHRQNAMHILTAHTLDDQAETLLFRMARGSGVSGLVGMRWFDGIPVTGAKPANLVRPLLDVPKARLIATLKAAKISYSVDPSNSDPRFTRPRLRKLMRSLAQEGLTAERLGKLAKRVERAEETLFAALNDAQIALCPGPWAEGRPLSADAEPFLELPHEIGLRLLGRMIALVGQRGGAELAQLETALFRAPEPHEAPHSGLRIQPGAPQPGGRTRHALRGQAHRRTGAAPPPRTQTTEIPAQSSVYHRRLE